MTICVIAFLDGVGRHHTVRLFWMAPNAYGEGGYPLLRPNYNKIGLTCQLFLLDNS